MNGPPLAIYGAMRRWSAQHFRATLQGYFLPASIIGMAGYWLAGLRISGPTHYYRAFTAGDDSGSIFGPSDQPSSAWRRFSEYIYLSLVSGRLSIQAIAGRR